MMQEFEIELILKKVKEIISGYLFVTATVSNVNSEGCTIVFAGETTPTLKRYKRLASTLVAGDRVLMVRTGATWIILGKIM